MPRWLQIPLCLVLFAGAMLLIRAVLHAVAPPIVAWLDSTFGESGSSLLIFGLIATAGGWAFWLHKAEDRRRSDLSRRS